MSLNQLYSKKVFKHFRNPKNVGEIKKPDGVATVGDPVCGDVLRLFIKVSKKKNGKEFIKEVKFQTLGCAAALATASVLTEMVKGKRLEEVKKVNNEMVVNALGGLPASKIHCSVLAVDALKKAIENYRKKR